MNFTLRFRPEVVTDLEEGAHWYDERRAGLGAEFLHEVRRTLGRIMQQPEQVAANANGILLAMHRRRHEMLWLDLIEPLPQASSAVRINRFYKCNTTGQMRSVIVVPVAILRFQSVLAAIVQDRL